jgi:hypothetical protein
VIAAPRDRVVLEVRGIEGRPPAGIRAILSKRERVSFDFVRTVGEGRALYAAEPRWFLPWAARPSARATVRGVAVELDLGGGWTDAIDLPPAGRGGCCGGCRR